MVQQVFSLLAVFLFPLLAFSLSNFTLQQPFVLGQPNFTSTNAPSPPSANSLNDPTGLSFINSNLFVVDHNNSRTLLYTNQSRYTTGANANLCLTCTDFTQPGTSFKNSVTAYSFSGTDFAWVSDGTTSQLSRYSSPFSPNKAPVSPTFSPAFGNIISIAVDVTNQLIYTCDIVYNRVLKYSFSNFTNPMMVYGQDYISNSPNSTKPNKGGGTVDSTTLDTPQKVISGCNNDLWIADKFSHRLLHYGSSSRVADIVLGQINFSGSAANQDGSGTAKDNSFNLPLGMVLNKDCSLLFVVDNGNSRILKFRGPYTNGMAAEALFTGLPSIANLNGPIDVAIDEGLFFFLIYFSKIDLFIC